MWIRNWRHFSIMNSLNKPRQNSWLWWVSGISLVIGISVFILLRPDVEDYEFQRIRSRILISSFLITGLCVIIGTSRRWFGKNL